MNLREWFERLAPRERLLVAIAGAFIVVALIVIGAIRPLMAARSAATDTLADRRAVLNDIDRVAARFGPQAAGGSAPSGSDESLVLLVDRTTRSHNLGPFLKRNEPDGTANIRLRFENAPFDALMTWLADLQTAHGISVMTATADPSPEPGRVSSNLQLTRAVPR